MTTIIAELFQKVPDRIRGWLYLAVVVAGIGYIGWTAWQSGLSVDQLVALFLSIVGALANSNRPTVRARTSARRRQSLED